MISVPVRALAGICNVPRDRTSASKWLKRRGIPTFKVSARGGIADAVHLSDLPEDVRRAFLEREAQGLDLDPGTYDDEAHARLLEAPAATRSEAERKAAIMRFLAARRQAGMTRAEAHCAVWAEFGREGNSPKSLDRWEAQVKGVAAVNFDPALMDRYSGGAPRSEISPEAWAVFEGA